MLICRKLFIVKVLMVLALSAAAQRTYSTASVLASGNWYKISVGAEGIYKVDVPFLNTLGLTGAISSASLRLYGNGGAMLPEAGNGPYTDDLQEVAISVVDGGDGQLNGGDYFLFYSPGPHHWLNDSASKSFTHQKNRYSDKAYYYIAISGTGKRIGTQTASPQATATITSFDERYFAELDTVNFLSSGKEWYGEEFSSAPGRTLSRSFALPFTDILTTEPSVLKTSVVARSVNNPSGFSASVNNVVVQQIPVPAIGTSQYDLFAQPGGAVSSFTLSQPAASLVYTFSPGSFNSQGWLNWFEFFCRRPLSLSSGRTLLFRDWRSVGTGGALFSITTADAAAQVWDVTDGANPVKMNTVLTANNLRFTADAQQLREYACFSGSFLVPQAVGKVLNQNLHSTSEADYIIITYPSFLEQAQRLATFHRQYSGLRVVVVTTDQVFNEFASGAPDPTAIRDYVKMYYDRYRASWSGAGKYLLLFGKGSYDYKDRIGGNTNLLPVYESTSSLDPLSTYTSDDFFGFLDDHEDINNGVVVNQLDIGIGRIAARTPDEAKAFVDKVLDYHSPAAFGPWRNTINLVADDEDYNLHLQDAESFSATISATAPQLNQQKVYLDAFQQESGSAGGRYPGANAVVNNNIYNGTLIWNYSGHGGPPRLAEEVIIDQQIVNSWNNPFRLPLFITGTCDFAPYDNPVANSLGENLLVRPKTGAIALMTTTRVVFANSNQVMNNNYLKIAFQPDSAGHYKSLGEAVMAAKNYTYQTSGDIINNRKFALLGDPAMTLGFPQYRVQVTSINGRNISAGTDTLRAMQDVEMQGDVVDRSGAVMANFNGTVYLTLFDKVRSVTTLANDATSLPVAFPDQETVLFRGKATIQNGSYTIRFKVPRDINYQFGRGKISLYAQDGGRDGNGYSNNISIGGIMPGGATDTEGPSIKAFLNDEKFVNGSITNTSPVLLLQLSDSSGINTASSGVNHDIVATLDDHTDVYYVLNNFYETELDNFRRGTVRFQLPAMEPGAHSLKIKAWDVMNNSSEYILNFVVTEEGTLTISHVLNYPNPFTTSTTFWFEHNHPRSELYAKVEIYTLSGKLIKTIARAINTVGNRSSDLEWDGRDDWGQKTGRGVYIYRLLIKTAEGKTTEKWERLVIL